MNIGARRLRTRIAGRPALERSLRSLLIRTHRFANGRAASPADQRWAGVVVALLSEVLRQGTGSDTTRLRQ
jgi:hypothetical protein